MLSQDICNLYRHLPVSVLVFEGRKLVHINKHLFEIFSIDEQLIDLAQIKTQVYYTLFSQIAGRTIENDSDLFDYLMEHDGFDFKHRKIQVDYHPQDQYVVFVITLLKTKTEHHSVEVKIDQANQKKILSVFAKSARTQFELFSTYKGLHIRSHAQLLSVQNERLSFTVSRKHLSSYHDTNEFVITPSNGGQKVIVANALDIDIKASVVHLGNLRLQEHSAKDRRTVHIRCIDQAIPVRINHAHKHLIYDLSIYSLSIQCDNAAVFEEGEAFTLQTFLPMHNGETFNVTLQATLGKVMTLEDKARVIFLFKADERATAKVRSYLSERQMELLRELKQFVEMDG